MNKEKMQNRKLMTSVVVVLLVLVAILVGIFLSNRKKSNPESVETNETVINQQTKEVVSEDEGQDKEDKTTKVVRDDIAFFEIDTKHCKLYFPERWKEQIEIGYSEEFGYKVEFYGIVEGKEKHHLFNVCFNSDDGLLLGYLETGNENVNISIDRIEIEFDDSWKQEEMDQIYAMQEEMNYVIDSLSKNENYVEP